MFGNILLAFAITVVLWAPIAVVLAKHGVYVSRSEIIVKEAKAAGRVVEAVIESHASLYYDPEDRGKVGGRDVVRVKYVYEVDGCKYKWVESFSSYTVPETRTLYYEAGKPKKAIPEDCLIMGSKAMIATITPVIIWAVVMSVLSILLPLE